MGCRVSGGIGDDSGVVGIRVPAWGVGHWVILGM